MRIPGVANFDLSLVKNTRLQEGTELQFRWEIFNLFNRANFGAPSNNLFRSGGARRSGVGRITNTITTARQIQFALKLLF